MMPAGSCLAGSLNLPAVVSRLADVFVGHYRVAYTIRAQFQGHQVALAL